MTGSNLAWLAMEVSAVVAIREDYKKKRRCRRRQARDSGSVWPLMSSTDKLRVLRRIQVLVHENLEVQQLAALGIANAGDFQVSARQWRRNVLNIEEQESRLRRVRLNRLGGKLRRLDLLHFLLADRAFDLAPRNGDRKRNRPGIRLRIRQTPVKIVGRSGRELRMICRK